MARIPWEITKDMFLSVEETDALLDYVRARVERAGDRDVPAALLDQVIIEGLLFTGVRCSEFCRLPLREINLRGAEPAITVRGPGRDHRTVFIPGRLCDVIQSYLRDARTDFLPDGVKATDSTRPLVYNEHRRPFERTGLYRRVVRILTEAGLGDRASVQLLRHTYGYLAYLRTGGNLLFVQRQLGHAHPMITSVYARFVDHSYADLAEMVSGVMSGAKLVDKSRTPRKTKGIVHGVH